MFNCLLCNILWYCLSYVIRIVKNINDINKDNNKITIMITIMTLFQQWLCSKFTHTPKVIIYSMSVSDRRFCSFFLSPTHFPRGVLQTQKWRTPLLRTQSSKILCLEYAVGGKIALYAFPNARDFFLCKFRLLGPFAFIFFQTSPFAVFFVALSHPAYRSR